MIKFIHLLIIIISQLVLSVSLCIKVASTIELSFDKLLNLNYRNSEKPFWRKVPAFASKKYSFYKNNIGTGNVFCKQSCQQGSVICTLYVQYTVLQIKYNIIYFVHHLRPITKIKLFKLYARQIRYEKVFYYLY